MKECESAVSMPSTLRRAVAIRFSKTAALQRAPGSRPRHDHARHRPLGLAQQLKVREHLVVAARPGVAKAHGVEPPLLESGGWAAHWSWLPPWAFEPLSRAPAMPQITRPETRAAGMSKTAGLSTRLSGDITPAHAEMTPAAVSTEGRRRLRRPAMDRQATNTPKAVVCTGPPATNIRRCSVTAVASLRPARLVSARLVRAAVLREADESPPEAAVTAPSFETPGPESLASAATRVANRASQAAEASWPATLIRAGFALSWKKRRIAVGLAPGCGKGASARASPVARPATKVMPASGPLSASRSRARGCGARPVARAMPARVATPIREAGAGRAASRNVSSNSRANAANGSTLGVPLAST